MKILSVIWNPSYDYKDQIIERIPETYSMDLIGDFIIDGDFHGFIDDFYGYPSDEKWKSDYKYNDLVIYSPKIVSCFYVNINSLKKIFVASKNKSFYEDIFSLKQDIRNQFCSMISSEKGIDLYYENVLHMADDEEESIRQLSIIRKYGKKIK